MADPFGRFDAVVDQSLMFIFGVFMAVVRNVLAVVFFTPFYQLNIL
jgi:hypothetical protein